MDSLSKIILLALAGLLLCSCNGRASTLTVLMRASG